MTFRLHLGDIDTPLGRFAWTTDDDGALLVAGFTTGQPRMDRQLRRYTAEGVELVPASDPGGVTASLRRYFEGDHRALDGVRVALRGTAFQNAVWTALLEIPCGDTWSYADLARHIGNPAAVRAVGLANGANPIAIVVPCHRVIGSDGSLTGYGGGIERKRWLLEHERRVDVGDQLTLRGA